MSAAKDLGRAADSSVETAAQPTPALSTLVPSDPTVRFTPGTMLAGRYRVVAPLGKGGMGEVYRADDTRLGQPVALKFLPAALAADAGHLERLKDEVKIGRQISHPNVCRLYDIVEGDGHHFLVMEYVDGEDLASLLRRIGRLPADKALEMARDLCAGLAAAHDKGVIHRDLKPANVMIDGRGHARIADFGLATPAGSGRVGEVAGTMAYMAPEQLAGEGASLRSDVFALGLVLYEMFTGRRPFEAKSLEELKARYAESKPPSFSSSAGEVGPAVERVVLSCLARNPLERPASAAVVQAVLPGGDPLQAALLAGETPSPEMVAVAAKVGDLRPAVAWACITSLVAGVAAVALLSNQTMLYRRVRLQKSPDVLVERARDVLRKAGYNDPPSDSAYWVDFNGAYAGYLATRESSPTRVESAMRDGRGAIRFVYRQSPSPLEPGNDRGEVEWSDPPLDIPGMATVELDPDGRLAGLYAVPPGSQDQKTPTTPVDWSSLLSEAGFEHAVLKPSGPKWTPSVAGDFQTAWEVPDPAPLETPVRVEAASNRGRPVSFRVLWIWDQPAVAVSSSTSPARWLFDLGFYAIGNIGALLGAIILAHRNLRLGRGDRRGAFRIALFLFSISMLSVMLGMHHMTAPNREWSALERLLAGALWKAAKAWVFYVGLEPYARRRWPGVLIAWCRLLAGRFRDPLVGREVLAGALAGTAAALLWHLGLLAPAWLGIAPVIPSGGALIGLGDALQLWGALLHQLDVAMSLAVLDLLVLVVWRIVLRNDRLAVLALVVNAVVFNLWLYPGNHLAVELSFITLIWAAAVFVLMRFGVLALASTLFFFYALVELPTAVDLSIWYGARSLALLLVLASLATYAFYTSLGGKPIFGRTLLED